MTQLTLSEEIVLLSLDDETGRPVGRGGMAPDLALAGAMLMDLALAGRVDTDREKIWLVDGSPSADPVASLALAALLAPEAPQDARGLIQLMARDAGAVRERVLERLISRGILKRVEDRILWVFADRRYPKTEERAETEDARGRLRTTLLRQDIPEPRDALLLGLARAAGLLPLVFSAEELRGVQPWLELVTRIESLNRSLGSAVAHVRAARVGPG